MCVNLKDAEWTTIPFGVPDDGRPVLYSSSINFHTVLQGPQGTKISETPIVPVVSSTVPPNPYGSSPFLIKIQVTGTLPILIYDRTRDFQTSVLKSDCPPHIWKLLADTCKQKGCGGRKLFVWAKRTADKELVISLNRLPDQNSIPW